MRFMQTISLAASWLLASTTYVTLLSAVSILQYHHVDATTTPTTETNTGSNTKNCERLKASLSYSQEDAPSDLSRVLPVIVERINRELDGVVDVEVEWKGSDFLKGTAQVGEHIIQCTVSRLTTTTSSIEGSTDTRETQTTTTQCYHVPFTITDTNECLLRSGHPMRHSCDETSTICVNTIGSYECVCPRLSPSSTTSIDGDNTTTISSYKNPTHGLTINNPTDYFDSLTKENRGAWELSYRLPGLSSCPNTPSTYGCCTRHDIDCKTSFTCPVDPCSRSDYNDCSRNAKCIRKATPNSVGRQLSSSKSTIIDYTCQCPVGYMGNGHTCTASDPQPNPKVTFDGITATEETIRNNYYCDCTVPVVDACAGFPPCTGQHQECSVDSKTNEPKCACKKGYMYHETYGCVDESPPVLILKHDPNKDKTLRLRQGDSYTEYAVDIHDVNAEEYLRSLKIAYSIPLPPKCFLKVTEFHVNYTIATPWTVPPYVRITRRVIIDDINECTFDAAKYKAICPELIPKCDPSAKCVNTVGSYKCQCPEYTSGDGFQKGLTFPSSSSIVPEGYVGGQGCVDTTKPLIQVQGPNPKKFLVAECSGVSGVMNTNAMTASVASKSTLLADKTSLKQSQQSYYAEDIMKLIKETNGAELCATHYNTNPDVTDCVHAYDMTANGRVDLSREVVVGDPVQKSALRWSVPYNVHDEAGNVADTVWRDVIVEEVKLHDIEKRIRNEILSQQKLEVDRAVEKGVRDDRRRMERESKVLNVSSESSKCPACEACPANMDDPERTCPALDATSCAQYCSSTTNQTCATDDQSVIAQMFRYFEQISIIKPSIILALLICLAIGVTLVFLRIIVSLILLGESYIRRTQMYTDREIQEEEEERQRRLLESVTYHSNGTDGADSSTLRDTYSNGMPSFLQNTSNGNTAATSTATTNGFIPPPRASMTLGTDRNYLTPQGRSNGQSTNDNLRVPVSAPPGVSRFGYSPSSQNRAQNDLNDIYEDPSPIITPSKRGDGVSRTWSSPCSR